MRVVPCTTYATRWFASATSQAGATVVTTTGQKVVDRTVVVPRR
ncbi:hypothetical protein [Aeromicrobium sp. 50.2.37]|nr:hypothetical protein [Aeromicrobium sp. 50.2.37]MCR4513596.1 hypothetical protein [Aeromicrobium sp. 50.2.37]